MMPCPGLKFRGSEENAQTFEIEAPFKLDREITFVESYLKRQVSRSGHGETQLLKECVRMQQVSWSQDTETSKNDYRGRRSPVRGRGDATAKRIGKRI
jgi:hypothetical protein